MSVNTTVAETKVKKVIPKLTQKAYLNAVASFLDFAAKTVVSLAITPILVSGLGSVLFGVWQILGRLVSYLSAADGRPTHALKWVIANHQSTDDHSIKRRAVGSALGVWLLMLPFMIVAGAMVVWLTPIFTGTTSKLDDVVRLACGLLVFNMILSGFVLIPEAVLRGMNLGYKRMGIVAGLNILGGILTVAAIYFNWGLIGIAAVQIIVTIITGFLFWYLVKQFLPWFGVAWASWLEIRKFFGLSLWYAGWNIVDKLLVASDVIVLGLVLSASTVTTYVLTGYVAQAVLSVMTIMVRAAAPGFGKFIQLQEYNKIIQLRNEMLWFSSLFAGATGSTILLWNHSFITLWTGSEHYAGNAVNLLLVLIAIQLLFIRNETFLIDLTLDLRYKVVAGAISTVLSIGLALLLVPVLGIIGLCIAILIGRSLLTMIYPMIINSFLDIKTKLLPRILLRPVLVMLFLFVITSYMSNYLLATSWFSLIVYTSLTFLLSSFIQFLVGFSGNQRHLLIQRITRLRPLSLNPDSNLTV